MAAASRTIAAVAVTATLLMTTTAFAQRGDGGRQRGGQRGGEFQRGGGQRAGGMRGGTFQRGSRMQSEANLIRRSDVQKDIKLTDEQKTQLEALRTEMETATRALFAGFTAGRDGGSFDREAMRAQMEKSRADREKMQKEANTKIKAILTPQQWSRLGQIKVQMAGARAVMDPEIEKKLELTATQKLQISKLNDSLQEANGQIFRNGRENNVEMADMMAEVEKNNKYFESELANILTADQLKVLDEMKGELFKPDPNYRPDFGGRGGRDGGGRRRGGSTGGGTGGG